MTSKTQQALDWLAEDKTRTEYAAAKLFELAQSTIMRARKARDVRGVCECCGQMKPVPTKKRGKPSASGIV